MKIINKFKNHKYKKKKKKKKKKKNKKNIHQIIFKINDKIIIIKNTLFFY